MDMRGARGVTLVELLVVVAIMAALASFFVPRYLGYRQQAREARGMDLLSTAYAAVTAHEARTGGYSGLPCNWNQPAWDGVRSVLAIYAQIPAWSQVSGDLINDVRTCWDGYWADGSAYTIAATFTYTTGWIFVATPAGVYKCDRWNWWSASYCTRP